MSKTEIEKTNEWINSVAKKNNCTRDEVLRYIKNLSSGKKVIYHLTLV